MQKFADFIIKNRRAIRIIFLVLALLCALSTILFQNVNSDITTYLPQESDTARGQRFLMDKFGIKGDVMVSVGGVSQEELAPYVQQIADLESVSSINWIGNEAFSLLTPEQYATVEAVFTRDDMLALLITLDHMPSTPEAFEALDDIREILDGLDYAIDGSTELSDSVFEGTVNEVGLYMIVAVVVVLLILFLTTRSWLEPLVLLLTLGISIIINLGTNILLGEVSIITFSASSILQLGLAMDYAIFMIHSYHRGRENGMSQLQAVKHSIPETFLTVFASALTTVGGFAALYAMEFTIGADLAKVLIKGIVLTLLTVILLQPCLILLFDKWSEKATHRYLNFKFKKSTGFAIKYRLVFVIAAIILLVPSIYYQGTLSFNYLSFQAEPEVVTPVMQYAEDMSNQLVIAVPVSVEELDKQYEFLEELKGNTQVSFVLGLCSMMDYSTAKTALRFSEMLADATPEELESLKAIPNMPDVSMLSDYVADGYCMYTIGLTIQDIESPECIALIDQLHDTVITHFGDSYYMTGMAQSVYDFSETTPHDFKVVTIVSVIIIFVILLFALRSLTLSFFLVVLIEFGIWINLGLSAIIQGEINFMSYIIISSIQLGATVDYAILVASAYQKNVKAGLLPENAAFTAVSENAMAVLTSAGIMAGACLSVYFVASNLIVAEITMLIARGSALSCGLTLLLLPCILTVKGNIKQAISVMRKNKVTDEEKKPPVE